MGPNGGSSQVAVEQEAYMQGVCTRNVTTASNTGSRCRARLQQRWKADCLWRSLGMVSSIKAATGQGVTELWPMSSD